jgi:ABC-type multidrug transport system fused ATPase/permease subunit
MFLLLECLSVIAIIGTISSVLPIFLTFALAIVLCYWAIGYIYLASSRELKRSDSVTKSPIFSVFGEVLAGVSTIRAFGDSTRFAKTLFALLDRNNRAFFPLWQSNRWLSVRVDIAGAMVTLAASLFVLASANMDAALAGFIVSFAIAFVSPHCPFLTRPPH